jgi:dipeptidyl aminopeptidase/acylaminoacyl peptidase
MNHFVRTWSGLGLSLVVSTTVMTATAAEPAASAPAATPRLVTLEDIGAIKWPGAPRVSPDGRLVTYAVDDQVFVVPIAGGTPRAVTSAGSKASDPRWSRDGKALFFLSDRAGKKYQVWKLPIDTFGEAQQLSDFDRGIEALNLSPDESQVLLTIRGKYEPPGKQTEGEEGGDAKTEKKPEPFVIDRLHFKEDAADGYITGDRAEHLYVYDFRTRALKQITTGAYSESEAAWSPDGRRIVFASNREPDPDASYKADLWIVDANNTDGGQSLVRLTNDDWTKSAPAWSPDGRTIAYIAAEDGVYGIQHVALVPAAGGTPKVMTLQLDRWVNDFRFSADGQWIYFVYEELGGAHLARVRLNDGDNDGKIEKLVEGERQISAFDVSRSGAVAARIELMNDPAEIYSVVKGRVTKLTGINDAFLATVVRGAKESVEFASPDGTRIQAFVTKPPGFAPGRKYPTMLHIHGGPVGQFAYGYDFPNQYLAAHGYVVVEPNPRGSTGRGQQFIRAIYQAWGITDFEDLIASVDYTIAQGYSDADRLAVYGYSYGGYMTNWVVARSNRFKAAASGAGHSLIYANYGHDIYQKWYNWELGVPWENEEKYARLSPLKHAGNVTTPTIFLGGRDDWNVPVLNAELFYQSLKKRGIDTRLVVYPDTHHGGWSEDFEKDRLLRIREWFDKYLQPGPAQAQAQ